MRSSTRLRALSVVATLAVGGLLAAACGSDDDGANDTAAPTTAATDAPTTDAPTTDGPELLSGDITVFAAASLTAGFTEIGDALMAANPDLHITFNFAASSELVTQINEGAPADVFASADQNNMTKLTDAGGNAGAPAVFAHNLLQIIVGAGNPKGIESVKDITDPDLIVVTCAPEVPCGKYATTLFANAGITVTPKSLEENVKAVVTKVTLGEADAGIVYRTDVIAAGADAEGIDIPEDINVQAEYPIVVTKEAADAAAAQAFVDFVLSEEGQAILASYGFLAP